jgi:hypothetical protein
MNPLLIANPIRLGSCRQFPVTILLHSRLGWMSPAIYGADRRSAALRSTDGSCRKFLGFVVRKTDSDAKYRRCVSVT